MTNPFPISDQNLKILLDKFTSWSHSSEQERNYAPAEREKSKHLKETLLNHEYLKAASNDTLIKDILSYSKTLEGPAKIKIGVPRVTGEIENLLRNLKYLLDSDEDPFSKAENILDGKYKIPIFAKAFWSPIFQAQYPTVLPNWNNKTEQFFNKVAVIPKKPKSSLKDKYKIISEAFLYLQKVDPKQDFFTLNHLMHYGVAIEEGRDFIDEIINPPPTSSSKELCLVGSAGGDIENIKITEAFLKEHGSWASWWSFPLKDEAKNLLKVPFYLYINTGGGTFSYRYTVQDYKTSKGNMGIPSPWPEITEEKYAGKTKDGDSISGIFKTWFKVTEIKKIDPPLNIKNLKAFPGLSNEKSILLPNAFGYVCALETTSSEPIPPLNTILYGPPGTGKTYTLQKKYMGLFTESQTITQDQFAQELVAEMTWLQVITVVLHDVKEAKVSAIFDHPLLQAKNRLSANRTPKNTIWAWLQQHTKLDCPNVKHTQRNEPLIFWKDENATWSVDRVMVEEQLPELTEKLRMYQGFKPVKKEIKRYDYVTLHQSYCYEDFVEGIKPVMSEEDTSALAYEIKPGIFKNMVTMALNDPNHNYALLIDEINRGNVASIFGELIALIEEDKRKGKANELKARLPYSREEFIVPDNLYIIGAMNTADRSVEALDTALRRRFTFVAVYPQPGLIQQPAGFDVDLRKLLVTINGRIEKLLDKDHCIGHSYFMEIDKKANPLEELRLIFKSKILPLLEEYFYGDPGKIGMVLGKAFVVRKDETIQWANGDWGADDYEERRVYALANPMTLTMEDFRSVYGE